MAYPIATLANGKILYSDGSQREPVNQTYAPNMTHMTLGAVAVSPSGELLQTDKYAGNVTPAGTEPIQVYSGGIDENILRSHFGFNDPNVIRGILNDPAQVERYRRELEGSTQQTQVHQLPPTKLSYTPLPQNEFNYTPLEQVDRVEGDSFSDKLSNIFKTVQEYSGTPISDPFAFLGTRQNWLRQGLGNFADAISKFGWEQFNQGKPWKDTGFSEALAGGRTKNTALAEGSGFKGDMKGKATNILPGSEQLTLDPSNYMTQLPQSGMGDYAKQLYDQAYKEQQGFAPTDLMPEGLGEIYAAIDPAIQEVNDLLVSGQISQEEGLAKAKQIEMDALKLVYEKLNQTSANLIPGYENVAADAISEYTKNKLKIAETGEEHKMELSNRYGEALRSAVKDAQVLESRRRNIFSNLGTVESSTFMEEQAKADTDLTRLLTKTRGDEIKQIADIDKQIFEYTAEADEAIARIKRDRDLKIKEVQESRVLSGQEQAIEMQKINVRYENALADLQNDFNMKRMELINQKATFAQNMGLIKAQGDVDANLLGMEYSLAQQAAGLAAQMPPELDSELRGFLKAPSSSYQNSLRKSQLVAQYPGWAELIEQVFGGGINEVSYDQIVGGGTSTLGSGQILPEGSYIPSGF